MVKAVQVATQNCTSIRSAIVACALERHRAAKGTYPETLQELVPAFVEVVPQDLFDGQPLRYRRLGNGSYQLYSIGWNSLDDRGTMPHGADQKPEWSMKQGDWVWRGAP